MEYEAKQAIYLPFADYLELELYLLEKRSGTKPEVFLMELLKGWLAAQTERLAVQKAGPALSGFQWKTLFLPAGTILRTNNGDAVEYAKVIGNCIISADGEKVTPSLFVNRHAKGRNAWRFVWLRFPGNDCWTRADDCRACSGDLPTRKGPKRKARQSKSVDNAALRQSVSLYSVPGRVDTDLNRRAIC